MEAYQICTNLAGIAVLHRIDIHETPSFAARLLPAVVPCVFPPGLSSSRLPAASLPPPCSLPAASLLPPRRLPAASLLPPFCLPAASLYNNVRARGVPLSFPCVLGAASSVLFAAAVRRQPSVRRPAARPCHPAPPPRAIPPLFPAPPRALPPRHPAPFFPPFPPFPPQTHPFPPFFAPKAKKLAEKFGGMEKSPYLCTRKREGEPPAKRLQGADPPSAAAKPRPGVILPPPRGHNTRVL